MDPSQQYSPEYLAEDRSRELLNVVIAFAILETVFVALFFTARAVNKTANGWDVYLMVPAYLFCFSHIIVASVMLQYGGAGRHMVALDPVVVVRWLKLDVAEEFIYNFSILFPKLAILCLFKRVFSLPAYRYAIYALGATVLLTCMAGQIVGIAICQPFAYLWDKSIQGGHCGDIPAAYRYISIPNLLTDVGILALPLFGIWRLHTKVTHKIGLTITFLMGCIGMITGIIRLIYFFQIDMFADVTWHAPGTMSWTLIEPGVYLIAATLPSLRPLLRNAVTDTHLKAVYHGLLERCSRVFTTNKSPANSTAESGFEVFSLPTRSTTVGNGPRSAGFVKF
ncbi:MAG: hypothetical protein Q9181_003762 [Wetmoreana brouardii]